MPNLALNQIPYRLKKEIFSRLEPEDSLKFLKTSTELREFVLKNGVFPKRIAEIEMIGSNLRMAKGIMILDQLMIKLRTKQTSLTFEITDLIENHDQTPHIPLKVTDFWIFRKIRLCRMLEIDLNQYKQSSPDPQINFQDFLSDYRFLDQFILRGADFKSISPIFPKIRARIDSEFVLSLKKQEDIPEMNQFSRFFTDNLRDCREIRLVRTRLELTSVCANVFRLQSTTGRQQLMVTSENAADFLNFAENLLKNPSNIPEIVISLDGNRRNWPFFEEIGKKLRKKLETHEKIEDPVVQWELFERFTEKLFNHRRFFKKATYFRRQVSEKSQIFYILTKMRFDAEMRFYAKVEDCF